MSATRHILIVEDDPMTRQSIALTLTQEGYTVKEAGDAAEALEELRLSSFDLIILDITLPDVSGFDLCRRFRASNLSTPVMFLSARTEEIDIVVGLELGADDFMTKPFRPRELLARVAARLRSPTQMPENADGKLTFRELVIDPGERRVTKNGKQIHLTHTEFELLHFLATHAGAALGREKILAAVWGANHQTETRVIDVHVRNLRRKLEEDAARPSYILAVPGIGYRFTQAR